MDDVEVKFEVMIRVKLGRLGQGLVDKSMLNLAPRHVYHESDVLFTCDVTKHCGDQRLY